MSADYIPIVDLGFDGPSVPTATPATDVIARACRTSGFFVITGHGVQQQVVDDVYTKLRQFFTQPIGEKLAVAARLDDPLLRGYIPGQRHEQFYVNRLGELSAHDQAVLDERLQGPNRWPDIAGLREAVLRYYAAMEDLAARLAALFALSLDLDRDWFAGSFDRHMSPLVGNYYPAQPLPPPAGSLRNAQHRDWCAFTILYQDDAPGGLQVLHNDGRWIDVAAVPQSFVINIGRLMARWTGGAWTSTVHRVVNPPPAQAHRDRISVPFFYHPNPDQSLDVSTVPGCSGADGETAGAFHIRMADSSRERKRLPVQAGAHLSSGIPAEFPIGGISNVNV
jgi:isopenicillin N synthase-like dioxygenase